MKKARLVGMASYLPDRVLGNAELEQLVDTSDEWIVSRVGIQERRIAAKDEASSDMGIKAAQKLLAEKEIPKESIDLILVATMTPDFLAPSTAALIQGQIGLARAAAFDFQASCSGFIYGLSLAKAYIESGMYQRILLISTEKMSAFVDYQDRNTCVLFGDGASAALIEGEGSGLCIDSVVLGADGTEPEMGWIPIGGSRNPPSMQALEKREQYFKMQGKELFKKAVRRMAKSSQECLALANVSEEEVSWVVPHQANSRIIDAVAKTFSIDPSRVYRTIHKYGNTSSSGVAIALDELVRENPLSQGERILLCTFGVGLTWGASVLRKI